MKTRSSILICNLLDLKAENEQLKARIKELETQLNDLDLELKDSQELTKTLITINEQFGKENDDLYRKLSMYEKYEKLRKPRIMEKNPNFKRKHARYHMNFITVF
jgi:regulator of replication initiation timing